MTPNRKIHEWIEDGRKSIYHLYTESLRITLHRLQGDTEGNWYVSCHYLDIDSELLAAKELDQAKRLAIMAVKRRLERFTLEVRGIPDDLTRLIRTKPLRTKKEG